jgi:threonine dehydratase
VTPLEQAPPELAVGREVLLKREDVHELGAFKWRGALPTVAQYEADGAAAVVTASTGNHGAAVAWAAPRVGLSAVVFVPETASRSKLSLIEAHGAELRLVGRDLDEAKEAGLAFAEAAGARFFEDGAEPAQLDGYAGIATEVLEQLGGAPAAIVVPVGNGALVGGIGRELSRRSAGTLVVGVAAAAAPVMARSFEAGRPVEPSPCATFADGLAVRVAIPFAVEVVNEVVDRLLVVSERELAHAVGAYHRAGIRTEGAGAATLAALAQVDDVAGPIVLVVTGRNIDDELLERAIGAPDSFPA